MTSSVGVQALQRVLVLGSGTAGTSILNALARRSQHFATSLLVRPESVDSKRDQLEPFQSAGVHLVQGDLSASLEELAVLFTGFDVVLSCVGHERYRTDQVKVVQAAKAAGVQRYFPTAYGVDMEAFGPSSKSPVVEARVKTFAAISEVGLPYTIINSGFWSEWLLTNLLGIDYDQRVVTAVDTFASRVSTTALKDLGELICEVLLDPSTVHQSHIYLASDTVTLEELTQAVERATGQSFERRVVTLEEMERRSKAAVPPKMDVAAMTLTLIHHQEGVWWPKEKTWNETHPISYQVTPFSECAQHHIKSGAHLKASGH